MRHREAQVELRREWDAHAATALSAGDDCFHTPGYRDLIERTQDLDERGGLHAELKTRMRPDRPAAPSDLMPFSSISGCRIPTGSLSSRSGWS